MSDTTALQAVSGRIDATPVSIECGAGWHGLLEGLDSALSAIDSDYVLLYVGRDCGRLVYEARPSSDVCDRGRFEEALRRAAKASTTTCEVCGRPGRIRRLGGLTETLCKPHQVAASRHVKRRPRLRKQRRVLPACLHGCTRNGSAACGRRSRP